VYVVFVSALGPSLAPGLPLGPARSVAAAGEAALLASALGLTEYEVRLALAVPPPAILLTTTDEARAEGAAGAVRARGHEAWVFDDTLLVPSEAMTSFDDFRSDPDGIRRQRDGALLAHGDVFAILAAVHDLSRERVQERYTRTSPVAALHVVTRHEDREHVAYFFRRSGERPWLLRERHTSYEGLGHARKATARANFEELLSQFRKAAPRAVFDNRLLRRRPDHRFGAGIDLEVTRQYGMDLLAHLLATSIASQGGSPYR
jgi:hypothetical protein